jgi:hypothetical protein
MHHKFLVIIVAVTPENLMGDYITDSFYWCNCLVIRLTQKPAAALDLGQHALS